jgi:hypothetical protein
MPYDMIRMKSPLQKYAQCFAKMQNQSADATTGQFPQPKLDTFNLGAWFTIANQSLLAAQGVARLWCGHVTLA